MFYVQQRVSENCAIYELLSKRMVEPESSQLTNKRAHVRCTLDKQDYRRARAHMHTSTYPSTPHSHTHTHTHTHKHTHRVI